MEVLSRYYDSQVLDSCSKDYFVTNHAQFIVGYPQFPKDNLPYKLCGTRQKVMEYKIAPGPVKPRSDYGPISKVSSLDWRLSRNLVEQYYCVNLFSLTASRTIAWNGVEIDVAACFHGLEEGRDGGDLWFHIPYSEQGLDVCSAFVEDSKLDHNFLTEIHHLMLVARSNRAIISTGDGSQETLRTRYFDRCDDFTLKMLDVYAGFQKNYMELKYG